MGAVINPYFPGEETEAQREPNHLLKFAQLMELKMNPGRPIPESVLFNPYVITR